MTPQEIRKKITNYNGTPDYGSIELDINKLCEFLSTLTK